jgi:hypothetical protein
MSSAWQLATLTTIWRLSAKPLALFHTKRLASAAQRIMLQVSA